MSHPHVSVYQGLFDLLVKQNIGPAKPVDRLLWISHDKQLPRRGTHLAPIGLLRVVGGQEQQNLSLQRIGVLELVYKKMRQPLLEVVSDGSVSANQVTGADQQVNKVERPGTRLLALIALDQLSELGLQQRRQVSIGLPLEFPEVLQQLRTHSQNLFTRQAL